jgi:hypothetical protein
MVVSPMHAILATVDTSVRVFYLPTTGFAWPLYLFDCAAGFPQTFSYQFCVRFPFKV